MTICFWIRSPGHDSELVFLVAWLRRRARAAAVGLYHLLLVDG